MPYVSQPVRIPPSLRFFFFLLLSAMQIHPVSKVYNLFHGMKSLYFQ